MTAPGAQYALKPFKYSSHYWVLRILAAERAPLRILDVGTASGYLGGLLRDQGHYVAGVESDRVAAAEARRYYNAFDVADVGSFEFPAGAEFDYIVFADVLEHLPDPAGPLRRCIPALKQAGKIIVSVPNVAHLVVRLGLLVGRFDYRDRGILDRTHLRFFTLRSLRQLLLDASYRITEVIATPAPLQLAYPMTTRRVFDPLHELHHQMARAWKTMLAYQFVLTAAPNFPLTATPGAPVRP